MFSIYHIPRNFEDQLVTYSGKSVRNVVEAVIAFAIVALICFLIPVHWTYKIIAAAIIGLPLAIFNFIGIQNNSVTEFLILLIRYKTHPNEIKKVDFFNQTTPESQNETTTKN